MILSVIIYGMIALGSALMVYNIYSYVRYARAIRGKADWGKELRVLHIPIILLVMFLFGYLAVGIFGKPDIIISGILFGGSIFVFLIFWVLQRITKKIQATEQLKASLTAAEENSRLKSSLLSSVSHEMRTPMNAVLGLNAMALKDPSLSPGTRESIEKSQASARHLLQLIDNVLDINDTGAGSMTLKNSVFSLPVLIEHINDMISIRCAEKDLVYESGRAGLDGTYYSGDETQLMRLLLLLLDNAVKFTDAGGRVSFTAEHAGRKGEKDALRFAVSDTGVGIDARFLPHIFDVLTREDSSSTDRFGGSGLGLSLAKRIAAQMDGEISVQSEKGKGSIFTVTVFLEPSAPPPVDFDAAGAAADKSDGSALAGKRILVVEDLEINAEIIIDLLEMEGAEADHAENGQVAVDKFSSSEPWSYAAVLMDLRMPVMDGLTAARRIRQSDRADAALVPIIALTANNLDEDIKNTSEAGMNAHLAKPVDSDLLINTLQKFISAAEKAERQRGLPG
ncbi:MAG: response regulator [Oscillospiraceae bacterium]|nr:response regulator [Oscillospiraceae bacterium]